MDIEPQMRQGNLTTELNQMDKANTVQTVPTNVIKDLLSFHVKNLVTLGEITRNKKQSEALLDITVVLLQGRDLEVLENRSDT